MWAISHLRHAARRHPHVADLAIAVAVYVSSLITTVTAPQPEGERLSTGAAVVAGIACGVLVVRRRWPFAVLLVSAGGAEVYLYNQGHDGTLILAAPLIALYTVAELADRRRALVIAALAVLGLAGAHALTVPSSWAVPENLALTALGGLAVAAGDASRTRRAYLAEVEERARRAEHDREEQARRRVTEERLRIARDLHDTLGHHLTLINVQAGVTMYVLDDQPVEVRQVLDNIRQASRSALDELRDTIGLLREPGEAAAPTDPTVGLAGLDGLVQSFRRSGLQVDHEVRGPVRRLAPAADLTAYRVVQESLTNVCKHAGDAVARLLLEYQPTRLRITVDSSGSAPPPANPRADLTANPPVERNGHGIAGMRERTVALGGSLNAGPRPTGGFRVRAILPIDVGLRGGQ